jgi:hypothetical protein
MMVRLFDPSFGAHWDKGQWVMRRLQWAEPHDIDDLIERHDTNMCRLRSKGYRDARWTQDKARMETRFDGVEKWKIRQAVKRSYMKLKRIDRVLTMLDLLLKYLGYHTYWSERLTYARDTAILHERPMKEQDRQKCHW